MNHTRTWARYTGPRLELRYTDPDDLAVLYHLPGSPGWSVRVIGNPVMGSYEWLIEESGNLRHSDCGYGDSDIALRDGLIARFGLPGHDQSIRVHSRPFAVKP